MKSETIFRWTRIALLTATIGVTTLSGPTLAASWSDEPRLTMDDQDRSMRPPKGGGFDKDDADGDGQVTQKEFSGPSEHFKKLDRNGDGVISRQEAKPPEGRGERPPR